jgi:hypothetical protein
MAKVITLGTNGLQEADISSGEAVNIEALSADKTLTATDAPIQIYTITANRIVNLPTTNLVAGQKFEIWNDNAYNSTYYITIKQGTTSIYYLAAQSNIALRWDTTNWVPVFNRNVSVGFGAYFNYTSGVGIGYNANNNFTYGTGVGYSANNNHDSGVGIGNSAGYNYTSGVGIGDSASSNYSSGVGIGNSASNNYTYGTGIGAYATTNSKQFNTIALGAYSKAERNRELVSTATQSTPNKAQLTFQKFVEKDLASNSSAWQELFIDGTSARLTIIASSVYQFMIQINAIDKTNFNVKTWKVEGTIKRDGSNVTSIVGSVIKTIIAADVATANWDVQVTADDTNEDLKIEVKHDSANSVRYSLNVFATETRI